MSGFRRVSVIGDNLIVAAQFATVGGQPTGSATVFSGRTGRLLYTLQGSAPDDQFGYALAGGADVNGDFLLDLIVSAPMADITGTDSGTVEVFPPETFGSYQVFGEGCGNPAPSLTDTQLPRLGQSFELMLSNLPTFRAGVMFTGLSNVAWGPISLPVDLTSIGMTGCTLYASGELQSGFTTHTSTTAYWGFSIPNNVSLAEASFFNQAFVIDPLANPLGVITTNAGQATVGY